MTLRGAMGLAQADAKLKGATGYQVNGNTVTLNAASVYNSSAENASGTLMLKLMTGVEYSTMSGGKGQDTFTFLAGIRAYW